MCCSKQEGDDKWPVEKYVDGAILKDRSCTDCPCILIFLLFIGGWIAVLAVAFAEGDPERILKPSNFRDELCGDGRLEAYPDYFAPLPNRPTYGICVSSCPEVMSYVCNSDVELMVGNNSVAVPNFYYNHTQAEFQAGQSAVSDCLGSCSAEQSERARRFAGLMVKLQQNKCFLAFYETNAALYRCLPFNIAAANATLLEQANATLNLFSELSDKLGIGSFFMRGFSECEQTWRVIVICSATAIVISLVWIFLLRWVMAPIVYLCIILVFAVIVLIGVLAMLQADNLEDVSLPGETGTDDQVKVWRAIEYIAFLAAAMYIVVVLVIIKRIRIAIILMEESSKAFLANPVIAVLPLFVLVLLLGFGALFFAATLYIQTIGDVNFEMFEAQAINLLGEGNYNKTQLVIAAGASFADEVYGSNVTDSIMINVTNFNSTRAIKALHAYNFFMFLWVSNVWIMFAFFVMAMVIVTWYYSATGVEIDEYERGNSSGRMKGTAPGTFCRSIFVAIRYHFGTIIFGALLIAIIQFIRAVVLYIEKEFLDKWKDNATMKIAICCVNCLLACIERIIRAISKGAFVITCITNDSFCPAAQESLGIMISNIIQVGSLQSLSLVACTVLKVFIVATNMLIAFALINVEDLTDDREVESGLFPLFFIAVLSYAIAALFVNVFESCVDTIMMCYFIDEKRFDGRFMPPNLAKIVGQFQHIEKARRQYKQQLKSASLD